MSAGSGIVHSEVNADLMIALKLLQIWVLPNRLGGRPSYAQTAYSLERNIWTTLVAGESGEGMISIRQDASFRMGMFDAGSKSEFEVSDERGTYAFVIDGAFDVAGHALGLRDALAITGPERVTVVSKKTGRLLLIDVPMFAGE